MNRISEQRGQAMVLTVLSLTALVGMATLVLDLGSWFRAQRALQSAADAAALAGAQALPDNPGAASALANDYALKNGATGAEISFNGPNTINVKLQRPAPGFFAKVFGIDSVQVGAKASARTDDVGAAKYVAPIVVNEKHPLLNCEPGGAGGKPKPCFGVSTEIELHDLHKPGSGDAAGSFGLIDLMNQGGSVGSAELAAWLQNGFDKYMQLGDYDAVPSTKFNSSHIRNALDIRLGTVLLFPIYRTIKNPGSNAQYSIIGWVAFEVDDYQIGGDNGKVRGKFKSVIWEGLQATSGGAPNYGVRAVQLVE